MSYSFTNFVRIRRTPQRLIFDGYNNNELMEKIRRFSLFSLQNDISSDIWSTRMIQYEALHSNSLWRSKCKSSRYKVNRSIKCRLIRWENRSTDQKVAPPRLKLVWSMDYPFDQPTSSSTSCYKPTIDQFTFWMTDKKIDCADLSPID